MSYTMTSGKSVIRDADNAWIPDDPSNADWVAYQGWLAKGNKPNPYVPPIIVPVISRRQFFQQAAVEGLITQDEAVFAVSTGAIPAVLQTIVSDLEDAQQQFAVKMLLSGATVFERTHPLTVAIADSFGWTDAKVNQFFTQASGL